MFNFKKFQINIFKENIFQNFFKISKNNFTSANTSEGLFIPPKLYADANLNKDQNFLDFEKMKLKFG